MLYDTCSNGVVYCFLSPVHPHDKQRWQDNDAMFGFFAEITWKQCVVSIAVAMCTYQCRSIVSQTNEKCVNCFNDMFISSEIKLLKVYWTKVDVKVNLSVISCKRRRVCTVEYSWHHLYRTHGCRYCTVHVLVSDCTCTSDVLLLWITRAPATTASANSSTVQTSVLNCFLTFNLVIKSCCVSGGTRDFCRVWCLLICCVGIWFVLDCCSHPALSRTLARSFWRSQARQSPATVDGCYANKRAD